jgi:hypothetical protein
MMLQAVLQDHEHRRGPGVVPVGKEKKEMTVAMGSIKQIDFESNLSCPLWPRKESITG